MEVYKYKVTDQIMRNMGAIEAEVAKVLKEIKASETIIELDYSQVTNQEMSTTTGLAMSKLIKAGFPKVVITGFKDKDQFTNSPVTKLLIERGQLEVK